MTKLLSIEEAAELLGLGKPTVYRLTSQRKIPFYKVGSRVLFDADRLTAWLEKHYQPARLSTELRNN